MNSSGFTVAVVGATGLVGSVLFKVLEEQNFPVARLKPLASGRSAGTTVTFKGEEVTVEEATPEAFDGVDVVFFAATGALSKTLAPEAAARGALVIDKSNTWRMHPDVPLVVPEINPVFTRPASGIVACPNCTTIGLVMALEPLRRMTPLRRVIVTSFQAVSGTGKDAVVELEAQLAGDTTPPQVYHHPIAHNVLPYAESFAPLPEGQGYTTEELKLQNETRKIFANADLPVTMTCCRVPVRVGHSLSVLVETVAPVGVEAARRALSSFPGVTVVDNPERWEVPTPLDVAGRDDVLVGRLRRDLSSPNGLWMWVVSDNLRKGAATNAVQIARDVLVGR